MKERRKSKVEKLRVEMTLSRPRRRLFCTLSLIVELNLYTYTCIAHTYRYVYTNTEMVR